MSTYVLIPMIYTLPNAPGVPPWRTRKDTEIKEIIVHHTGGPEDQPIRHIHDYHRTKDWGNGKRAPRIVYHYCIAHDGTQYKTNRITDVTWHCPKHNRSGLSVCVIGNRDQRPAPRPQWQSLVELCAHLARAYKIPTARIHPHSAYVATACPGRFIDIVRLQAEVAAMRRPGR